MSEVIRSVDSLRSETADLVGNAQGASNLICDALASGAADLAAVRMWLKLNSTDGVLNKSLLRDRIQKSIAAARRIAALLSVNWDGEGWEVPPALRLPPADPPLTADHGSSTDA